MIIIIIIIFEVIRSVMRNKIKSKEWAHVAGCVEKLLAEKQLRRSAAREEILGTFLNLHTHVTANELYRKVCQRYDGIGFATVYRTLRLLCGSGFARQIQEKNGVPRYEILLGKEHHDHLICLECGCLIELEDPRLEYFQAALFKKHGYSAERHRMDLYGVCPKCRRQKRSPGKPGKHVGLKRNR